MPPGGKNYITPQGFARLRAELLDLMDSERPKVVEAVRWAAKNGDRSENGDYLYGKKRLREIDRRIRFLTKRLENAEVVDPAAREATEQVFFAATVRYVGADGAEVTVRIVGVVTVPATQFDSAPAVADVGKRVYASAATAGEITLTAPTGSGNVQQRVGILVDGSASPQVLVQIGDPVTLA